MERKKAIEIIKKNYPDSSFTMLREALGTLIPELKENEDERIRACIRMCLTDIDEQRFADLNTNLKECRDWLKKQGEQKYVPAWMPKFLDELRSKKNYFDWDEHRDIEGGILAIIKWMNPNYFNGKDDGHKPTDKIEPRQEKLTEFERAVKQVMEEAIECGDTRNLKADADMLLSLVHKSAWSEEDEKILSDIVKDLVHPWNEYIPDRIEDEIKWLKNKFKSLRPQSTWKPSDEQIKVLAEVLIFAANHESPHWNDYIFGILKNLTRQLKKLREE